MRAAWLVLTYMAFLSTPGRFCSIFYQEHHLDEAQVGVVLGAPYLLTLVIAPIACAIADRMRNRELTVIVLFSTAVLAFHAQIIALPSLDLLSDSVRFYLLLSLSLIYGTCCASVFPLLNAIILSQLIRKYGESGHERYGHEYMFAVVSWGTVHIILGAVLDISHMQLWIIHVARFIFSLVFIITLCLFIQDERRSIQQQHPVDEHSNLIAEEEGTKNTAQGDSSQEQDPEQNSAIKTIKHVLFDGHGSTLLFFNMVFWLSSGMSIVESLIFLYFKNELGASNFLCGFTVVITVLFEIPLFAAAPQLLTKYGAPKVAILGSLSYVVRGFVYAIAPNAYFVLLVEPLHGVTFATYKAASVSFVAARTPKRYTATGQSILSVVEGLARTIATSVGGYVIYKFGSKVLYGGTAFLVLLATAWFGYGDSKEKEDASCVGTDSECRELSE